MKFTTHLAALVLFTYTTLPGCYGGGGDSDTSGGYADTASGGSLETFECACSASYKDEASYYDDTITVEICTDNPDVQAGADECVNTLSSQGYYNIVCACEATGISC